MSAGRLIRARYSFQAWNKGCNHGLEYLSVAYGNLTNQNVGYQSQSLIYRNQHVRHMGMFREFCNRLKGEVEKDPVLQKSLVELKEKTGNLREKTGNLRVRTSQTLGQMYMYAEELQARARRVSSVVTEKIQETIGKTTSQTSEQKHEKSGAKTNSNAAAEDPDMKAANGKDTSSKIDSGKSRLHSSFLHVFNAALDRIKNTKVVGLVSKGFETVKEELTESPTRRTRANAKAKHAATSSGPRSSRTDVVPVVRKRSIWEQRWDFLKGKAVSNGIFKRFKGVQKHPLVVKGQEIVEDVREVWETSDNPMVHKIQDLNDSLFGETTTAIALKEIRKRDPTFSFPDFLAEVEENARDVLQAYLKGDIKELQKWCSREVLDRCRAERRAYESQGIFLGNKILHVSDIELKETKLMGNAPIIIITFRTQQVYCVFDKNGKITQGSKDDILNVYYAWAMQQVSPEEMPVDEIFPQWQLREMQQMGVKAII